MCGRPVILWQENLSGIMRYSIRALIRIFWDFSCAVPRIIASVPIKHLKREVGESNYTFGQLLRLWSSIIGFSVIPLRVASIAGFFFAGVGILAAIAIVIRKMVDPNLTHGLAVTDVCHFLFLRT